MRSSSLRRPESLAYYAILEPRLQGDNTALGGRLTYANNWFNIYAGHGVTEKNFKCRDGLCYPHRRPANHRAVQLYAASRRARIYVNWISVVLPRHHPNTSGKLIYRRVDTEHPGSLHPKRRN